MTIHSAAITGTLLVEESIDAASSKEYTDTLRKGYEQARTHAEMLLHRPVLSIDVKLSTQNREISRDASYKYTYRFVFKVSIARVEIFPVGHYDWNERNGVEQGDPQ